MNKSKLEYVCKKQIETELLHAPNALKNYNISVIINRLAIMTFLMGVIAIIIADVYEKLIIPTNTSIIIYIIFSFVLLSFLLSCISYKYKSRALCLLEDYYNKKEI